ncbi:DUF3102 domain-containing protein [Bradyrhizobium vignae]|uniref:DUF3102 domain-containing protein n=1 Tax=Bradyrhizobium vignae TaxID=1549949 RepID=UPI0013E8E919|nr:DUF3102 domain-containing protein [Bradyrhizobium vignae]
MTKRKNRSLETIADDIHKLQRASIFDLGNLLIEAKAQCEHGNWLSWIWTEFEYAPSTAERYMNAARLNTKFPIVRNLRLAANTVYALVDECVDDDLPAIIDELAKHATDKRLTHREAERVIKVGIGRHRHGDDHPDATLVKLVELDDFKEDPCYQKAVAALLEQDPETDEVAESIVDEIAQAHSDADRAQREAEQAHWEAEWEAKRNADAILDGPPPDLPSSVTPPEPQKLGVETDWETGSFVSNVMALLELHTKPADRFVGLCSPSALRNLADFLMAVAMASEQKKEVVTDRWKPEAGTTATEMPDIPAFLDRRLNNVKAGTA